MDLLLLQSLLAVADHKSVTQASRTLAVTQPALTRRIQLLEEEMGAPLFLRSKKGAELTEAGRLVAGDVALNKYDTIETWLQYDYDASRSCRAACARAPQIHVVRSQR